VFARLGSQNHPITLFDNGGDNGVKSVPVGKSKSSSLPSQRKHHEQAQQQEAQNFHHLAVGPHPPPPEEVTLANKARPSLAQKLPPSLDHAEQPSRPSSSGPHNSIGTQNDEVSGSTAIPTHNAAHDKAKPSSSAFGFIESENTTTPHQNTPVSLIAQEEKDMQVRAETYYAKTSTIDKHPVHKPLANAPRSNGKSEESSMRRTEQMPDNASRVGNIWNVATNGAAMLAERPRAVESKKMIIPTTEVVGPVDVYGDTEPSDGEQPCVTVSLFFDTNSGAYFRDKRPTHPALFRFHQVVMVEVYQGNA